MDEVVVPAESAGPVVKQPVEVAVGRHEEYDFRNVKVEVMRLRDGTKVPRLRGRIVRYENDNWKEIGHFSLGLSRVKRDDADIEDLAISFFNRINPKA